MSRAIPPELAERLASGVTTLARAWAVTRADGTVMGFTDHDAALSFDDVTFEAASGFTAQAVEQATGLSVDSHGLAGALSSALSSAAISDLDLERGLYDGAEIRLWIVDWTDVAARVLIARGTLGEVRRGAHAFEAEVAGLAERLNRPHGRAFLRACGHRLGDARCGVDLSGPAWRGEGTVVSVEAPGVLTVEGLDGLESGLLDGGSLAWTTGANTPQPARVKGHRAGDTVQRLTLWRAPAAAVAPGDAFAVTAGCDKTPATCRARFGNILNFGGFPLMPGDDWVAGYPNTGEVHDGGSLFR